VTRHYPEEFEAKRLRDFLATSLDPRVDLAAEGDGVHWHVDARLAARHVRVHMLGYGKRGFQFAHEFYDAGESAADGRTWSEQEVLAAIRAWVWEGTQLERLYEVAPFVDRRLRMLRSLRAEILAALEGQGSTVRAWLHTWLGDPFHQLWLYQGERSCKIDMAEGGIEFSLRWQRTVMAEGTCDSVSALTPVLLAWLQDCANASSLARQHSFVRAADCAPDFEAGRFLAWEWKQICALSADPRNTILGRFYSDLIPRLAELESPPSFFVFTSHALLCFSRSSHYSFSTQDLPSVLPVGYEDGVEAWKLAPRYEITANGEVTFEGGTEEVAQKLDELLRPHVGESVYGNLEARLASEVNEKLEAFPGVPLLVQRQVGESFHQVAEASGRCAILLGFRDGPLGIRVEVYDDAPAPFLVWKHKGVRLQPTKTHEDLSVAKAAKVIVDFFAARP